MNEALAARVAARLRTLRQGQLYRRLREPAGLDLCSNDYLGLSKDIRIQEHLIEGIRKEGCGSSGSRLLRGERAAFDRVERSFADFKRAERALYFSSGYLANIAVLATFPEPGDVIYSDERNHASLVDGIRLSSARRVIFPHNDIRALTRVLSDHKSDGHAFVVTESLFSMDGDQPPLTDYVALCQSTNSTLIVDEAHAVGVYGPGGSGLLEAAGIEANAALTINTAGKALGVSGAFVAGPSWAIEYLIQRARPFIFSTAPLPAVARAIEASLTIIAGEPWRRQRLIHLSQYLRIGLARVGVTVPVGVSQIVPIVVGENEAAVSIAEALQGQGFDVRAIRPPSVARGTARLRIAVNASLDEATLDRFTAALAKVLEGSTRWSAVSS